MESIKRKERHEVSGTGKKALRKKVLVMHVQIGEIVTLTVVVVLFTDLVFVHMQRIAKKCRQVALKSALSSKAERKN